MATRTRKRVTVAPASEPVPLADAKKNLKVDHTDDDDLIEGMIQAAREWLEGYMDKKIFRQTIQETFDAFPGGDTIELLYEKESDTDFSVKYYDEEDTQQTFDSSNYYAFSDKIKLDEDADWPDTRERPDAVTVTYQAGQYDSLDDIPQRIKNAIHLIVGDLYEQREDYMVRGYRASERLIQQLVKWST